MAAWMAPELPGKAELRPGDTIISVPAKSGTTWTMNIFHQLRTGGDPDFEDVYMEVPWLEFRERPDQPDEELLARWSSMPAGVPRAFKTHFAPGPLLPFRDDLKYVVVMRSPEEAMASFHPFLLSHSQKFLDSWGVKKDATTPESFDDFFELWVNHFPGGPVPGGALTAFFGEFISAWWPLRHKPNVLFLHYSQMVADHEGSIRRIAAFLGFSPTPEQWPKILEYTGFAWMKKNSHKFELRKTSGVPPLKVGAMVRKGKSGSTAEDGFQEKHRRVVREWAERMVPDRAARRWMFEGGELGGSWKALALPAAGATAVAALITGVALALRAKASR
eukprot:jgi/Tetstr1/426186/TSEL_016511.t1